MSVSERALVPSLGAYYSLCLATFYTQPQSLPMSDSYLGDNLIFIISQPRSGSTLLQRMLSGHADIKSAAETWLMLLGGLGLLASRVRRRAH